MKCESKDDIRGSRGTTSRKGSGGNRMKRRMKKMVAILVSLVVSMGAASCSIEEVRDRINDLIEENTITAPPEVEDREEIPETDTNVPFAPEEIQAELDKLPINYPFTYDREGEEELLKLLNDYRVENGLNILEYREDLAASARYKSNAMLQYDYFDHNNPNFENRGFDYLLWDVFNLKYTVIGENLASVGKSGPFSNLEAAELFDGWKKSPGHNAQMLNPDHRYIGIGVVRSDTSGPKFKGYRTIMGTQHFGQ
jgi:uncharacterized protein YkwD